MGLYFEVPKPTHTFRNPTPSWSESEGLEEPRKRAVAEPNVAKKKKAAMAGGNRSAFCFRNLILLCSLCLEHDCYCKITYTFSSKYYYRPKEKKNYNEFKANNSNKGEYEYQTDTAE